MAKKRYDATFKRLIELYPDDLPDFLMKTLGFTSKGPVRVVDSDVSTVSAVADKVFLVSASKPWILHLEALAGHNPRVGRKMLLYNVLLSDQHDLPVRSVALLLHPRADRRGVSGLVQQQWPEGDIDLEFRYRVVRLWELSVDTLLNGGLGLLPLAPLAGNSKADLPGVIARMEKRLDQEASQPQAEDLWVATYVLLGLEHPAAVAQQLLRGVRAMKESATYRAIVREGLKEGRAKGLEKGLEKGLAKGRAEGRAEGHREEACRILMLVAARHLGSPNEQIKHSINAITEISQLESMIERANQVSTWAELLAMPQPTNGARDHRRGR